MKSIKILGLLLFFSAMVGCGISGEHFDKKSQALDIGLEVLADTSPKKKIPSPFQSTGGCPTGAIIQSGESYTDNLKAKPPVLHVPVVGFSTRKALTATKFNEAAELKASEYCRKGTSAAILKQQKICNPIYVPITEKELVRDSKARSYSTKNWTVVGLPSSIKSMTLQAYRVTRKKINVICLPGVLPKIEKPIPKKTEETEEDKETTEEEEDPCAKLKIDYKQPKGNKDRKGETYGKYSYPVLGGNLTTKATYANMQADAREKALANRWLVEITLMCQELNKACIGGFKEEPVWQERNPRAFRDGIVDIFLLLESDVIGICKQK